MKNASLINQFAFLKSCKYWHGVISVKICVQFISTTSLRECIINILNGTMQYMLLDLHDSAIMEYSYIYFLNYLRDNFKDCSLGNTL